MKYALTFLVALFSVAAMAQQQPSTTEQALGQRVLAEVNANISCNASVIDLKKKLDEADAKLKSLQDEHKAK